MCMCMRMCMCVCTCMCMLHVHVHGRQGCIYDAGGAATVRCVSPQVRDARAAEDVTVHGWRIRFIVCDDTTQPRVGGLHIWPPGAGGDASPPPLPPPPQQAVALDTEVCEEAATPSAVREEGG